MDKPQNSNGNRKKRTLPEAAKKYRFKPGQSGNPGGRPKKTLLSSAYTELLAMLVPNDPKERTYAQLIAEAQAREAIKGKTQAAAEIADRTEGKAPQAVALTDSNGDNPKFEFTLRIIGGAGSGATT